MVLIRRLVLGAWFLLAMSGCGSGEADLAATDVGSNGSQVSATSLPDDPDPEPSSSTTTAEGTTTTTLPETTTTEAPDSVDEADRPELSVDLVDYVEGSDLHQTLVRLGAERINYLQWHSNDIVDGFTFWGWQAGEFVDGELSTKRSALSLEFERQGIELQSSAPEPFSWQGRDLMIRTWSESLGLYQLDDEPVFEVAFDFMPVGVSSTLTSPNDTFIGESDEAGMSRFITFEADGSVSEHRFFLVPVPEHRGPTLAGLLGVVSDRYAVYRKFDSWLAVQGDAGPEDFTYDMYDLVEQEWVHEFGPLESRMELGLVG